MLRSIAVVAAVACSAVAARAGDDNPAARAQRVAPADATKLPSGVAWKTIVRGTGAHPGAHDWVALYGARDDQGALVYFLAKPVEVDHAEDDVAAVLPQMKVGEKRRFWLTDGHVHDVELAAILPGRTANLVTFPPPTDAIAGSSGIPSVVLRAGRAGAVSPSDADVVLFDAGALDAGGNAVKLPITALSSPLADVPFAPVADVLREMVDGEERLAWLPASQNHGAPLLLHVQLVHVDHRAQRTAPTDLHAPRDATRLASGASFVVLARGTGEPPIAGDEAVVDLAVWTDAGRTVADEHGTTQLVADFAGGLPEQLAQMRAGERRRVWLPPALAGSYAEGGRAVVAELALTAIHRNFDLLPDGMRVELDQGRVFVVRGGQRAALPVGGHRLDSAKLSADRASIDLELENDCDVGLSDVMSLDAVRAWLEDAAGLALEQQRRYAEAADAFGRAIALDASLDAGYLHLAEARVKAGDGPAAARALEPLARRNPVGTYLRVVDDPVLAGVAREPAIAALRAAKPGNVDVAAMPVMLDPSGAFVAAPVSEGSWGSGDSSTRIEILDAGTGAIVATIPDVMWDLMTEPMTPAIQAQVAKSKAHAEGILDDLGFAAPDVVEAIAIDPQDSQRGRFAPSGLALELGDRVRVLRSGTVLAAAPPVDGHIESAFWVPSARLVVLYYGRAGHEGCEGTDPQGVAVIRVP